MDKIRFQDNIAKVYDTTPRRGMARILNTLRDDTLAEGIYHFMVELGRKRSRLGALMRQSDLSCTRNGPDGRVDSVTLLVAYDGDAIALANYINRHCSIEKPKPKPKRIAQPRKPKTTV